MKLLVLVRHAQASRGIAGQGDFDRPLDACGERDAPEMATRLAMHGVHPQLIVSSGALRALSTARKMAAVFDYPATGIEVVDALYAATEDTWIARIATLPSHCDAVLMVGHNPEISAVAGGLCRRARLDGLPPCGVVRLEYAIDAWADVLHSQPQRWDVDYPARLSTAG